MHELTDLQFEISRAPESCAALMGDPQRPVMVGKGGDQIELYSPVSNQVRQHSVDFLGTSCLWRVGNGKQTMLSMWAACVIHRM